MTEGEQYLEDKFPMRYIGHCALCEDFDWDSPADSVGEIADAMRNHIMADHRDAEGVLEIPGQGFLPPAPTCTLGILAVTLSNGTDAFYLTERSTTDA